MGKRLHFRPGIVAALVLLIAGTASAALSAEPLIPDSVQTFPDGREPIQALYAQYRSLQDRGWLLDVVAESKPPGRETALPVIALRTARTGPAVWILSGIHGEETAGPNAIAASIDAIAELGEHRPVVLLPLNNPQGYVHNWRYLNMPVYSPDAEGQSVGDSSHLLPDLEHSGQARSPAPSSPEADALTSYVLRLSGDYPPAAGIDLHEDNLISEGYVYSQGELGASDPLAQAAVRVLREHGLPLKMSGRTRFGEEIVDGIIGPVEDSSIDELMSAPSIIVNGRAVSGPRAYTVLVFETPAAEFPLARRVAAHAALLRELARKFSEDDRGAMP